MLTYLFGGSFVAWSFTAMWLFLSRLEVSDLKQEVNYQGATIQRLEGYVDDLQDWLSEARQDSVENLQKNVKLTEENLNLMKQISSLNREDLKNKQKLLEVLSSERETLGKYEASLKQLNYYHNEGFIK